MSKAVKSSSKNTSVISIRVDGSRFEKLDNQLSNLAATSVNSSGKLGITKGELLEQLLDSYVSNAELKDFINRDFYEQSSAINRRIDDLTNAVNTLTLTVENLRNIFVLTLNNGDINSTLSTINALSNRALVEQKSGADDFEFTTKIGTDSGRLTDENESDLIAAFQQINISNDGDHDNNNGGNNSRVVTSFQTLKQPRNFKKRLNN